MALSNIRIPNRHLLSFQFIASMPKQKQKRLVELLQQAKPSSSILELGSSIAVELKDDVDKLVHVVQAIISFLYLIIKEKESKREEFLEGVVEAVEMQLKPKKYDWKSFRETLHAIMDLYDSLLGLITRAFFAYSDYNSIMTESQIITDVRPFFYSDLAKKPEISIIVHNLKIKYMESEIEKIAYFTLDYDDLNDLISQLEQAKIKHERLQEILKETGLTSFVYYK